MTIEDQIKDELILIKDDINREAVNQVNLINMNTLLVKKYYHRINNK